MCRVRFALAFLIGMELICVTQEASAQLLGRFRSKKSQPSATDQAPSPSAVTNSISSAGTVKTASTEPKLLDFHGIRLGSSELDIKILFPEFSFKSEAGIDARGQRSQIRRGDAYFECAKQAQPDFLSDTGNMGSTKTYVSLVFEKDKLVNIHVMWFPTGFNRALADLTKSYGSPTDERKFQVKTENGRVLENHVVTWNNGTCTVRIEKYHRNADMSRILYVRNP